MKQEKYTSLWIQSEMLELMAFDMLKSIWMDIKNAVFCVMTDKTAQLSNSVQLMLRIRRVNHDLVAHEEFVGLYILPGTDAQAIVAITQEVFKNESLC